ncbi:hypothetical protein KKF91_05895 [Myxococcota bacterium]|nr:hypothetical protein [Myxococcota bacterium]MBU1430083.1 hypothetical protein [Myxococcota bacterium]MBU1900671.1 hypothetical protein [Myxococcota bacterium]
MPRLAPPLLLILSVACGAPPQRLAIPAPADLPQRVLFRDATETFNQQHWAALRGGRIWVRANADTRPDAPGGWHLLGETGLPEGDGLERGPRPKRIVAISGDGVHLMALSEAGRLYRGVNFTQAGHVEGWFEWTDRWGWPAAQGPGLVEGWPLRAWAVSDAHPFGVAHYEDINGVRHSVGLGVAHIYRLSPDGRRIHFNDWWLPADWSRQVCGPQRGRLEAINLSASASTIMLIDARGDIYTRLYDFDTAGENDLLTYSYITQGPSGTTRALPPEPWRRQPPIEGQITARITIFQDGEGAAARALRVEGRRGEAVGFFYKRIDAPTWRFEATGAPLSGPLLDPQAPSRLAPSEDRCWRGALRRGAVEIPILIRDLHPYCSPAQVELDLGAGAPLRLTLHHAHALSKVIRPVDGWARGEALQIRAALVLPPDLKRLPKRVRGVLGARGVINFQGTLSQARARLSEIMWTTPFLVPAREKAFMNGAALTLRPCAPLKARAESPPAAPPPADRRQRPPR